jgi:hypothetical protein
VAERSLSAFLGDAIVGLFEWSWPRVAPKLEAVLAIVGDAVRPDPPITIRTLDGAALTGVLIVDRGQVLAFLGSRHPAPSQVRAHTPDARYDRYAYDHDELWSRGVDPFRR